VLRWRPGHGHHSRADLRTRRARALNLRSSTDAIGHPVPYPSHWPSPLMSLG
jgi:hypothetical protein